MNEDIIKKVQEGKEKGLIKVPSALESYLAEGYGLVFANASHNIFQDCINISGDLFDIVSLNEYLGWYSGLPDACRTAKWETKYKKPFFISETGAGAKGGFHDVKEMRFSEEYQEWYYKEQVSMFKNRFPDNFTGLSPWILADFRSPRRNNPEHQEGWNRKGLIDNEGNKKLAFFVLKNYYQELEQIQEKKD